MLAAKPTAGAGAAALLRLAIFGAGNCNDIDLSKVLGADHESSGTSSWDATLFDIDEDSVQTGIDRQLQLQLQLELQLLSSGGGAAAGKPNPLRTTFTQRLHPRQLDVTGVSGALSAIAETKVLTRKGRGGSRGGHTTQSTPPPAHHHHQQQPLPISAAAVQAGRDLVDVFETVHTRSALPRDAVALFDVAVSDCLVSQLVMSAKQVIHPALTHRDVSSSAAAAGESETPFSFAKEWARRVGVPGVPGVPGMPPAAADGGGFQAASTRNTYINAKRPLSPHNQLALLMRDRHLEDLVLSIKPGGHGLVLLDFISSVAYPPLARITMGGAKGHGRRDPGELRPWSEIQVRVAAHSMRLYGVLAVRVVCVRRVKCTVCE